MSHTYYDIEMAGRKAREKAREDFAAGKPYENPYSPTDVIHFTYETEWKWAERDAHEGKK